MDENLYPQIEKYLKALRALHRSVEQALATDTHSGTSGMVMRSYNNLHQRVRELLPDEDFFLETLTLDVDGIQDERAILGQVKFATSQLIHYLDSALKEESRERRHPRQQEDFEDLKSLGRTLQEQIIGMTRTTLKRALANVDIDLTTGEPRGRDLREADFAGQDLSGEDLRRADMSGAQCTGANLTDADLRKANIREADLSRASMRNADLRKVYGKGANLEGADLSDADLAKAELTRANLAGAVISGARLAKANLSGANLSGADLSHSDARAASFSKANLTGCDLQNADLRAANFSAASLVNANLNGADIRTAYFGDADLTGATLPDGQTYEPGMSLDAYRVSRQPMPGRWDSEAEWSFWDEGEGERKRKRRQVRIEFEDDQDDRE